MKVAIMGYGTIGSGVAKVLDVNKDIIAERVGEPLELKYILDLREFPGDKFENCLVKDYMQIVNDPEVKVVVETMGGVEPAFTFVKAMLENGKSVTTSNKNLVAAKGPELLELAENNGTNFQFEAAVGGGIPVIRTITHCITGDQIEEISGIVNGTTNFMLTKMDKDGSDYEDVLKEAQELGYAEKDPTADVEGFDACRKIAILTSLISGNQVDYEEIPTEGISKISAKDFKYAAAMGKSVKLLARTFRVGDTYTCRVAPFMVDESNMLYHVSDVMNAVMIKGNMLGESMYYGAGAGSLPTASAVVGDMVYLAKHIGKKITIKWSADKLELADEKKQMYKFFVRTNASEDIIERTFADVEYVKLDLDGETGFVTGLISEGEFEDRVNGLGNNAVLSYIRLA